MPYTPPSKSPAPSAPNSPDVSRRSSLQPSPAGPRPALPRSASYLTRHRRTPAAVTANNDLINHPLPCGASPQESNVMLSHNARRSPPPVADCQSTPNRAVLSPESSSSDDDDLSKLRGRRIENLKELQKAISQIPQHRESSPDKKDNIAGAGEPTLRGSDSAHHSLISTGSLDDEVAQPRRSSHSRSLTEPNVPISQSEEASVTNSEDEERPRPPMVRKKSGELVRPALRPPSRRRPSSMPGTPTFSKAVHFDSHLEHVRHFLQVDRPLAVSAGSSPVDDVYDSDIEYPFGCDNKHVGRSPPLEWEIVIHDFPVETPARRAQPVRLERVWLSNDHKSLLGSVIVANLAFQKSVGCRFTYDYWKTTSEVVAEFVSEVTPRISEHGHDRFSFSIKLSDLANLETKTLYFAIKFNVNNQEYWDNNGGTNFQVDFRKKMVPENGKKGTIGASGRSVNSLPKSNRRWNPSTAPRPKSMPVGFDDFSDNPKLNFDQSIHEYLGETRPTSLRLKTLKSTTSIPIDNLSSRLLAPSGQAFANRYDFGASLSAAMQSAKDSISKPDGLNVKSTRIFNPTTTVNTTVKPPSTEPHHPLTSQTTASTSNSLPAAPGTVSPGATSIASSSYEEIVNKYCFFGSKQCSPQLRDGTQGGGNFDGTDDTFTTQGSAITVPSNKTSPPVLVPPQPQRGHGLQGQRFMAEKNSYFQQSRHAVPIGASPGTSPLGSSTESALSGTPRSSTSVMGQATGRTAPLASIVGGFQPLTGTSPLEFASSMCDRSPFSGTDAHSGTAIRGN